MTKKKWIIKNNKQISIIEKLLENRNISAKEKELFFNVNTENLYNPYSMKDLPLAVERILSAIENQEKICIYGDYDVDGISSVSILKLTFLKLGYNVDYYIPKRVEEGYGLNEEALMDIKKDGVSLVITVDCGITSIEETDFANSIGIDMIITDHHECKDILPKAIAIINPKQKECTYPYPNLCGAGIALKLSEGLLYKCGIYDINELIEIASIATIADIVELKGENRIIVKKGLENLKKPVNLGIKALISTSGLNFNNINSTEIAFLLAPRINSSGRMGDADLGVSLFLSESYSNALETSKKLEALNKRRQEIEHTIYEEALEIIKEKEKKSTILVAYSKNWHSGVIGIVASKITEKYNKPTFIIAIEDNNIGKGSGRSIEGFNLFDALGGVSYLLEKYGGHEQAAGITINMDNIQAFENEINSLGDLRIDNTMLEPKIFIDSVVDKDSLNLDVLDQISQLEPFGMGNSKPVFSISEVKLYDVKLIGKGKKHFKGYIEGSIETICFNKPELYEIINFDNPIDLVFEMGINDYQGKNTLQLFIKDIKESFEKYRVWDSYKNRLKKLTKNDSERFIPLNETISYKNINFESNEFYMLLDSSGKTGVFIYDYEAYIELIRNLFYRNINFSLDYSLNNREIDIILMPNVDKIDLCIYNNIILDVSINKIPRKLIETYFENIYLYNNYENKDISFKNIPSRDTIASLYKLAKKHSNIYVSIELLTKGLKTNNILLLNSLEILKEINLIEYDLIKEHVQISFNQTDSNQRFDLSQTKTMRFLNKIFN